MKKALLSVVCVVYLAVSTGFCLSVHYCMDRFDSTELGSSKNDRCPKCGMHKDGHCCRDEVKVIKLQTLHLATQIPTPDFSISIVQRTYTDISIATTVQTKRFVMQDHGPPLDNDLSLLNCVFRI